MTTISEKLAWRAYVAAAGIAATVLTKQAMTLAWRVATGSRPPKGGDHTAPLRSVITWALASGVGVGISKVLTDRLVVGHLHGDTAP